MNSPTIPTVRAPTAGQALKREGSDSTISSTETRHSAFSFQSSQASTTATSIEDENEDEVLPQDYFCPIYSVRPFESLISPSTVTGTGYVETSAGRKIYYELHGNGPNHAYLIAGMGQSSLMFTDQIRLGCPPVRDPKLFPGSAPGGNSTPTESTSYPLEGWTILVIDNSGCGKSIGQKSRWTTEGMAKEAKAVLSELGWLRPAAPKIDLVGISMGGMIALQLATMIPEHLSSTALCVTSGGRWLCRNSPHCKGTGRFLWACLRVALGFKKNLRETMSKALFSEEWLQSEVACSQLPKSKSNREAMSFIYDFKDEAGEDRSGTMWRQLFAVNTHHVAAEDQRSLGEVLGSRVKVLRGGKDYLVKVGRSRDLAKNIPGAELIIWRDARHGISVQCCSDFVDLLEVTWKEGMGIPVERRERLKAEN